MKLEDPRIGIMETEWAENRAGIPSGFIRLDPRIVSLSARIVAGALGAREHAAVGSVDDHAQHRRWRPRLGLEVQAHGERPPGRDLRSLALSERLDPRDDHVARAAAHEHLHRRARGTHLSPPRSRYAPPTTALEVPERTGIPVYLLLLSSTFGHGNM